MCFSLFCIVSLQLHSFNPYEFPLIAFIFSYITILSKFKVKNYYSWMWKKKQMIIYFKIYKLIVFKFRLSMGEPWKTIQPLFYCFKLSAYLKVFHLGYFILGSCL